MLCERLLTTVCVCVRMRVCPYALLLQLYCDLLGLRRVGQLSVRARTARVPQCACVFLVAHALAARRL